MGTVTLGSLVRGLREAADLSQEELAARAGVSRATIQNLENDRREPRRSSLRNIATALGASVENLKSVVAQANAGTDPAVITGGPTFSSEHERDLQRLRAQDAEVQRLRTENAELRTQVGEVEGLRRELQELRAEIDRLRQVRNSDAKSG